MKELPRACPLCETSGSISEFAAAHDRNYFRCDECGLISVDPGQRPSVDQERARYLLHKNHCMHAGSISVAVRRQYSASSSPRAATPPYRMIRFFLTMSGFCAGRTTLSPAAKLRSTRTRPGDSWIRSRGAFRTAASSRSVQYCLTGAPPLPTGGTSGTPPTSRFTPRKQ